MHSLRNKNKEGLIFKRIIKEKRSITNFKGK